MPEYHLLQEKLSRLDELHERKAAMHSEVVKMRHDVFKIELGVKSLVQEYGLPDPKTPQSPSGAFSVGTFDDHVDDRRSIAKSQKCVPHRELDDALDTMKHQILAALYSIKPYTQKEEGHPSSFIKIKQN